MSVRQHSDAMKVEPGTYHQPQFAGMGMDPTAIAAATANDVEPITDLGEGSTGFQTINQRNPLERTVVVSIRASLADLTTNAGKAVWAPAVDQLGAIFQQRQFVDVTGNAEKQGELRSVVVHSIEAESINSTFPVALGCKISGVDEKTYSSVGVPYSTIIMPNAKKDVPHKLQEDDVSVAYDFARRYPGYTADNLESNGVHSVPQRRFVLVAATHPLVTAIHENASALQTADITQMPEQLVKISTSLYDTLMPLVKQQVESQIRVADLSKMSVSISPADHSSWASAADMLTKEAVAPLKAEQRRALNAPTATARPFRASTPSSQSAPAEQAMVATTPSSSTSPSRPSTTSFETVKEGEEE